MRLATLTLLTLATLAAGLTGCRLEWGAPQPGAAGAERAHGKVVIYTSAYPKTVAAFDALAKQHLPGLELEWFQAGSEKITARLEAERLSGNVGADLLMTSDPIYYTVLAKAQALEPYASLRAIPLDRRFVDPDGHYVANRLSVIGLVRARSSAAPKPRGFAHLLDAELAGAVTMADPLASGTMLSALVALEGIIPDIAPKLRAARVTSSGGSTAVIDRLLRGEAQVGVVLYENFKLADDPNLEFIEPEEGRVVVPGYLALLRGRNQPTAARAVYDFLLGPEAQALITAAHMESPFSPGVGKEIAVDWRSAAEISAKVKSQWANGK